MFLLQAMGLLPDAGIPRTRGGVSDAASLTADIHKYSPHTRGCFLSTSILATSICAFPAHAGVFPKLIALVAGPKTYSPHIRGCFYIRSYGGIKNEYSPRVRGVSFVEPVLPIRHLL